MMIKTIRPSVRLVAPVLAVALMLSAIPAASFAAPPTRAASIPVVGTILGGGTFTGVATITSFAVQNGSLVALGTISGVATNAAGAATSVLTAFSTPVSIAQATCSILHLDLGPLSLNVLGLQANLSNVVLDITAQTGAGNLLGNLLCAVAGLLDNPTGLVRALNDLLNALLG